MNVQWGTFHRKGPPSDLLEEAETAMRGQGYQIYDPATSNDAMVIGGTADVIVQATAMPSSSGQTYLIVTAYSPDAAVAEQARNTIRAGINDLYDL
jgi:hypothetical protein